MIKSTVEKITPEIARKYLDNMVHNRPVSNPAVERYADDMLAGRWCMTGQGIIIDDKGRLIDGQHRMRAVIMANRTVERMVVSGVEAKNAFTHIDIGNKRTVSDVIDVKYRQFVAASLTWLYKEETTGAVNLGGNLSTVQAHSVLKRHPGIITAVDIAVAIKGLAKILPVGASAYCRYRASFEDPRKADAFLSSLATGADLGARSPILALRNKLLEKQTGSRMNTYMKIIYFIMAWNYYMEGRTSTFLRAPTETPTWKTEI